MAALGVIPVDGGGAALEPPEPVPPWDGAEDGAGWQEPYEPAPAMVAMAGRPPGPAAHRRWVAAYLFTRPAKKVVPVVTGQPLIPPARSSRTTASQWP